MKFYTRIPDPFGDTLNILDLFLTSNPSAYSLKLSFPLGSSDNSLIFVSCSITPVQTQVLADRSIATVVDGHCSPKTINSDVPQGSVLSPTRFLLFINDLLNLTQCPNHSYADDITLHFSTSYNTPNPTRIKLFNVRCYRMPNF